MTKGRKPQPDEIRNRKGDPGKRAKKTVSKDELPVSKGDAPAHLRAEAKRVWNKVAPGLRSAHLLRETDEPTLEICADMMADYWIFGERIRNDGYVQRVTTYQNTDNPVTVMRAHPLIARRDAIAKTLKDYIDRLGLSPIARTQLIAALAFRPAMAAVPQQGDIEDGASDDQGQAGPDPMNFPAAGHA